MIRANLLTFFSLSSCCQRCHRSSIPDITFILAAAFGFFLGMTQLDEVVFRLWGVNRTDDFGEIVFNLIDGGLMSKTDRDCRKDFQDLFDLDQALVRDYRIQVEKEAEGAV